MPARVFGTSLPASNRLRMDCGGNFVSISACVLCALRSLVVECSVPEAQSLRRSLQFDPGQPRGGFLPYSGSSAPSNCTSHGGRVCADVWTAYSFRSFDRRVCGGRNLCRRCPGTHFGRLLPRFIRISPVKR